MKNIEKSPPKMCVLIFSFNGQEWEKVLTASGIKKQKNAIKESGVYMVYNEQTEKMPGRSSASTTPTQPRSERLELAMAISSITTKQDAFIKAVETLDKYKTEILQNLDLEIESKKIELQDLEADFAKRKKSGQIETDQYLKEYQYKGVINLLENEDEEPIKKDRLKEMRDEIATLRTAQTGELDKVKHEERGKAKAAIDDALSRMELKHKAEIAQLSAEVTQQKKEIHTHELTIENMKNELAEQRKLTKDVAQAGRAAPITQNLAGKV